MVILMSVDVRYRVIFECLDCGAKQVGTTATYCNDALPTDGELVATAHEMPVGWASYGRLGPFKCPNCVT